MSDNLPDADAHPLTTFMKTQPPEWVVGLRAADLLLRHCVKDDASHELRSGGSVLLTHAALQRTEGFLWGISSALGALRAASATNPKITTAELLTEYVRFLDMANSDVSNIYHSVLRGLVQRPVKHADELVPTLEALSTAFGMFIQPDVINAILQTNIEISPDSIETPLEIAGYLATFKGNSLTLSKELTEALDEEQGAELHEAVEIAAQQAADGLQRSIEVFGSGEDVEDFVLFVAQPKEQAQ